MALFDDIGETMLRHHEGGRELALSLARGVHALRQRFRHMFGRPKGRAAPRPPKPQPDDWARLTSPSFVAQELDLAKEAGPNGAKFPAGRWVIPGSLSNRRKSSRRRRGARRTAFAAAALGAYPQY